ncbi:hypothetical protein GOODEAATRI_019637 [Goodea atripinnis]|uniref:Uncharacterized protein n=1 Tax=Goodea atripinnis TaxID=208336 RepID=A0ABV0MJ68_9TELE
MEVQQKRKQVREGEKCEGAVPLSGSTQSVLGYGNEDIHHSGRSGAYAEGDGHQGEGGQIREDSPHDGADVKGDQTEGTAEAARNYRGGSEGSPGGMTSSAEMQ